MPAEVITVFKNTARVVISQKDIKINKDSDLNQFSNIIIKDPRDDPNDPDYILLIQRLTD